ncbi:hypothetical protein C0Z18_05515 [Trinickia dabaoshanensis]|uniref:Methyltransferase domain-containing protein n=1 Tax=Trinickia dabaoshanensis TaxID=564714 RepID=A0A2N7VXV5_9BURK|nr:class I SAM-dependent methyltransferase [Trinickia dabaoshanensis]PMS21985.1 hypothetical protein C0Z18_05515 [Trinickia dabaoshanensis]
MPNTGNSNESTGREAYSQFAERYAEFAPTKAHNALYERPATMALVGDVHGLAVLDAGCGPGICSEHHARQGASVHAFDVTPEMVELARKHCEGLKVNVVEPQPLKEMKAKSERLYAELSHSPAFICIRARC